jgi:hypothetical protein
MRVGLTALVAVVIAVAVGGAQAAGAVSGRGTWETTLQYRDLDGNVANGPEAFYDTVLDISWLRDANVNMGNNINGNFLYWQDAVEWANNLVVNGVDGWRLPTMVDTGAPGCDFSYGGTDCGYNPQTASSELAHLFYVSLGNQTRCPPGESGNCVENLPGPGLINTGNFQNMQSGYYTTGLEYALDTRNAWLLDTRDGLQIAYPKNSLRYAMVVHAGAIGTAMPFTFPVPVATPVPEPESYAMMLLGLGIVGSLVRRRRSASA